MKRQQSNGSRFEGKTKGFSHHPVTTRTCSRRNLRTHVASAIFITTVLFVAPAMPYIWDGHPEFSSQNISIWVAAALLLLFLIGANTLAALSITGIRDERRRNRLSTYAFGLLVLTLATAALVDNFLLP